MFLSFGAPHGIEPSATGTKVHEFGMDRPGCGCAPLIKDFRLGECVPYKWEAGREFTNDVDGIAGFVYLEREMQVVLHTKEFTETKKKPFGCKYMRNLLVSQIFFKDFLKGILFMYKKRLKMYLLQNDYKSISFRGR
jgi:hypothetical protein